MTVNYLNGNPAVPANGSTKVTPVTELENFTIGVGFAGVIALLTLSLVVICMMVLS